MCAAVHTSAACASRNKLLTPSSSEQHASPVALLLARALEQVGSKHLEILFDVTSILLYSVWRLLLASVYVK